MRKAFTTMGTKRDIQPWRHINLKRWKEGFPAYPIRLSSLKYLPKHHKGRDKITRAQHTILRLLKRKR